MIAGETILISGRPGNDTGESVNHFIKTKTIAGNPKSIFTKIKNTFTKIKNQIYFSGNRSHGNILQEAGNKLKFQGEVFREAGNILKEESRFVKFPGNILQEDEKVLPEAGNKLKEDKSDLKNLGEGMIFMETFRKFEIPGGNFKE